MADLIKLNKNLKQMQAHVDNVRDIVLECGDTLESYLAEHDLCKKGLEDFVCRQKDQFSKIVRIATEKYHDMLDTLMIPGIARPRFRTGEV